MSFLLPQTREGMVQGVRLVDIHGDRYLDVVLALDDGATAQGRVSVLECPPDLAAGDRVSARFTMGVMTTVTRMVALLLLVLGLLAAAPPGARAAAAPAARAAVAREAQRAHQDDSLSVSSIAHLTDPRARVHAWEAFLAQHPHSDFRELVEAALEAERHTAARLMPEFGLPDLQGVPRRLAEFDSVCCIVVYWSPDCPECEQEVPRLAAFVARHAGRGLRLVGIVDGRVREQAARFMRERGLSFPVLVDDGGQVAGLLHADDTPMNWVVARGTVYYSNRGYDAEHQDPVVPQVELLLPPPGTTASPAISQPVPGSR